MPKKIPSIGLLVSLMMFPQIVETIYSPALTDISRAFDVTPESSSLTLSIYFMAFALGVVIWGRLSDLIGRRYAMLGGLICYALGSGLAVMADHFTLFLVARALAAFGASVGSIVTQRVLRDSYTGDNLAKVFAVMGMAISISPVVGFLSGGWLTHWHGYQGVLWSLTGLALVLLLWSGGALPETRPEAHESPDFLSTVGQLVTDGRLWCHGLLVALFNVMLFSYYSLAPFMFEQLGYSSKAFGYSGLVLGVASLVGSLMNKKLLSRGKSSNRIVWTGILSSAIGALLLLLLQQSIGFLVGVIFVVVGFGLVIPNVLSVALKRYRAVAGTAGAWFGLTYYLLIGLGLWLSGEGQNLGLTMGACSLTAVIVQLLLQRGSADKAI